MKSFLDRTFVNGNGKDGFLAERGYGAVTVQDDRGRGAAGPDDVPDRPEGRRARGQGPVEPKTSRRRRRSGSRRPRRTRRPRRRRSSAPGRSWSRWPSQPGERDFFARSIVNRIWHRLFGRGLVMPLDQMHSANPPSHPELLAWLARDTIDARLRPPPADPRPGPEPGLCPRAAAGMTERAAPADAVRRGRRPAADADATGLLAPAGDHRPGQPCPPDLKPEELDKPDRSRRGRRRAVDGGRLRHPGGDGQIGVAEALLFSNGERIEKELLADGDDRLVGRLKRSPRRPSRSSWPSATCSRRPPDDEDRRIAGRLPRAAHRPPRGGLPAARLGLADQRRIPVQSLIDRRIVFRPTSDPPERIRWPRPDASPSAARPNTPSTAAGSSARWPPARRRSRRT